MTNEKAPERVWLTVFTDDKEPHFTMLEWQSPVVRNTQPGDYVATRPHHKVEYVPASAAPVVDKDLFPQTDYKNKPQLDGKQRYQFGHLFHEYTFNNCDHGEEMKRVCLGCVVECLYYMGQRRAAATPAPVEQQTFRNTKEAMLYAQRNNIPAVVPVSAPSSTQARAAAEEIVKAWLWHSHEHDQERARTSIQGIIEKHCGNNQ